jgi:hypothetical protein
MKLPIGLALLAVGVVLLIVGINASESFAYDVSRFLTGEPTDRSIWFLAGGIRSIWFLAGGIAALVAGIGMMVIPSSELKRA